jgi:carboxylate-amine ligase
VRVPDAQSTVRDAAAVAAVIHALVRWLRERALTGDPLASPDTWRLEENRWRAARWGMDAELADPATGRPVPARECLAALLEELEEHAERLGCARELRDAARLGADNGAVRQRAIAAEHGDLRAVTAWLADAYAPSSDYVPAGSGNHRS